MARNFQKWLGLLLVMMLLTTLLSGFAFAETVGGEKITLTIEASQEMVGNIPYAFSQKNIDAFEAANPNIKVELILDPDAQATSILQTKIAAGQPSDLICYNKVAAENELEVATNCVDLSNEPFVERLVDKSVLTAPDGKIYGFAFAIKTGGMGLVYNEDMFAKFNLPIPKTFDELLAVCQTLTDNGVMPIYAPFKDVWTFQMWTTSTWGYHVAKFEPDLWNRLNANQVAWNEVPAFQESLEKAYSLFEKGYMQSTLLSDDYNGVPAALGSQKYAMTIGADVTARDVMAAYPDQKYGLFPFPVFEGEEGYLTVSQLDAMFFIPKDAKNVEAAKAYLNFMAQPEQCDTAQEAAAFAPNVVGAKEPVFPEPLNTLYHTFNLPGKAVLEMNVFMKVDLNDLWSYFQDMFAGEKTPEEVLAAWDVTFEELMQSKGIEGF